MSGVSNTRLTGHMLLSRAFCAARDALCEFSNNGNLTYLFYSPVFKSARPAREQVPFKWTYRRLETICLNSNDTFGRKLDIKDMFTKVQDFRYRHCCVNVIMRPSGHLLFISRHCPSEQFEFEAPAVHWDSVLESPCCRWKILEPAIRCSVVDDNSLLWRRICWTSLCLYTNITGYW